MQGLPTSSTENFNQKSVVNGCDAEESIKSIPACSQRGISHEQKPKICLEIYINQSLNLASLISFVRLMGLDNRMNICISLIRKIRLSRALSLSSPY